MMLAMSFMKPSKQFIDNFNLCMEHYEVTIDEAKFEKARVVANFEAAEKCYSIIAAGVKIMNKCVDN